MKYFFYEWIPLSEQKQVDKTKSVHFHVFLSSLIYGKGQQCDARLKAKHIDGMLTFSQDNTNYHTVDTKVKASEDSYFGIYFFLLYFEVEK